MIRYLVKKPCCHYIVCYELGFTQVILNTLKMATENMSKLEA
jgi:hypothetical protein